ncbi:MAG: site-specific integrase [Planctomycetales bacterium]|nr:site-specific integrase [Planctomycetales bacterium]
MPRERKLPPGLWKRGHVYYARFRCDGVLVRQRLSSDFRVACEMLSDLRLGKYRHSKGELTNDLTIEALAKDYFRSIEQTLDSSTVRRYRQNMANVARLISVRHVAQLNLDVIEAFREERLLEDVEPQTINKDVRALATMLNWAVKRKKIANNPILGIKHLPEQPKEARALEPNEVGQLLDAAAGHWQNVWYAFLTTGLRKMELASLLFTDVDWRAHELVIRSGYAKNSTVRRIPVDDKLFEIISRQRDEAADRVAGTWADAKTTQQIQQRLSREHVFVTTANTPLGGNIYREFMATCKRAGINTKTMDSNGRVVEIVDLHSTRHTFATDLIMNGADPKTVQTLMGHKTLEMTMRIYAKVFAQQKHAAIGKLSYGAGVTVAADVIQLPKRA